MIYHSLMLSISICVRRYLFPTCTLYVRYLAREVTIAVRNFLSLTLGPDSFV